jgi:hypothetical protein
MRVLGVHGAGGALYVAVVDDLTVLDVPPYSLSLPTGVSGQARLDAFLQDVRKVLQTHRPDRVRVLDAETRTKFSYSSLTDRVALETLVLLAASQERVDAGRLTRARARALLGLPKQGPLSSHASSLTGQVGRYWSPDRRDVAAIAALASVRE